MSFQKRAYSITSKLHLSEYSTPMLIGLLALVLSIMFIVGCMLVRSVTGSTHSFNIVSNEESAQIEEAVEDVYVEDVDSNNSQETETKSIFVHISGHVVRPGVVELPEGSRAFDAIEAAGGFTENAAQESLNLAREIQDGEQLYVYSYEEYHNAHSQNIDSKAQQNSDSIHQIQGLVNINTANMSQLESLPGIGESTAEKIIKDREQNGPFQTIEDLKRVAGIGEKKFEALQDYICVQ